MGEQEQKIKLDKRNYRRHNDENKRLIKKSLEELGGGRSLLLDADNEIIAGNCTFEMANELGIPVKVIETDGSQLIAVKRTDLKRDDEKRDKLAILDNSTSDLSSFDYDLLKEDFEKDYLENLGIQTFEASEIDVDSFFENISEDKIKEPKTIKCPKCGEIIEL